jgi:preprotein translocase subunit SecA
MAGRGVDIKLGGDPEGMAHPLVAKQGLQPEDEGYREAVETAAADLVPQCQDEAEEVKELGGLFILGTERHESRRIDNQLRGRAGRQGDPGASRFFLSAEDDVIRLFAGDRIYKILDRLGPVDEEGREIPLEAKMLTKTVENAQKKVEEQNFLIRKRVLEYDDVMNEQRRIIYRYRGEILEGRDISDIAREELDGVVGRLVDEYTPGDLVEDWDLPGLDTQLRLIWPCSVDVAGMDPNSVEREVLKQELAEDAQKAYSEREEALGDEVMRFLERTILLQVIDNRWREHLYDMDYLREGIHLRGFAQIDPLVAYKNEGYSMFTELINSIWEEFARLVFNAEIEVEPEQQASAFAVTEEEFAGLDYSGGTLEDQPSALEGVVEEAPGADQEGGSVAARAPQAAPAATKVKSDRENLGRNDPCWCGSGKKFKKCHGA